MANTYLTEQRPLELHQEDSFLFTDEQLGKLEAAYANYPYVKRETKMMLENGAGIPPVQIKSWFKNRRIEQLKKHTCGQISSMKLFLDNVSTTCINNNVNKPYGDLSLSEVCCFQTFDIDTIQRKIISEEFVHQTCSESAEFCTKSQVVTKQFSSQPSTTAAVEFINQEPDIEQFLQSPHSAGFDFIWSKPLQQQLQANDLFLFSSDCYVSGPSLPELVKQVTDIKIFSEDAESNILPIDHFSRCFSAEL